VTLTDGEEPRGTPHDGGPGFQGPEARSEGIGPLTLEGLEIGRHRELAPAEVSHIRRFRIKRELQRQFRRSLKPRVCRRRGGAPSCGSVTNPDHDPGGASYPVAVT